MASIGHVAVGMAAARFGARAPVTQGQLARSMVIWSALSLLPDADVVGLVFGVHYGDPWGHRGATHSFAFALLLGALVGAVARALRQHEAFVGETRSPRRVSPDVEEVPNAGSPIWPGSTRPSPAQRGRGEPGTDLRHEALASALLATLTVASHGVLDALTDGGRGCALFWPFSDTRHFAPFRPIPVAPIGLSFLSPRGLHVALVELLIFAPVFAYALWPRRQRAPGERVPGERAPGERSARR